MIKSMIKNVARSCGLGVSRTTTSSGDATSLFNQWVNTLQAEGPLEVVFDIGANRGGTAARFRRTFPEAIIYSFEPGRSAFLELKAQTESDPKIKTFCLALGKHDGRAMLNQNAVDATNSLLPNAPRISQFAPSKDVVPQGQASVPLMRIDTFCEKESIDHIDLLKIDTQGYEGNILEGAGNLLTPDIIRALFLEVLFVELYEDQTWCGEVLELLRSRGYRFFGFTGIVCDDTHGWKWADAMFVGDV